MRCLLAFVYLFSFASMAQYKATTCIAFTVPASVSIGQQTLALSASSAANLPITYESKTPAKCTVAGATATLKAAGTCTLLAKTAANSTYSAGQMPASFSITATVTPPPPPPVDALSIAIDLSANAPPFQAGAAINIQTKITGTDIFRVEIHNSCDTGYYSSQIPPFQTTWTPLKPYIGCVIYAEVATTKQGWARSQDVIIDVVAAPFTTAWSQQQKYFAACGACPSTGKIETESCAGYSIGLIDAAKGDFSYNMKWIAN